MMTNSYLRSFVEDQKDKHDDDAAVGEGGKRGPIKVRTTKAAAARAGAVKDMLEYEEAESTWKMAKFQNVGPLRALAPVRGGTLSPRRPAYAGAVAERRLRRGVISRPEWGRMRECVVAVPVVAARECVGTTGARRHSQRMEFLCSPNVLLVWDLMVHFTLHIELLRS